MNDALLLDNNFLKVKRFFKDAFKNKFFMIAFILIATLAILSLLVPEVFGTDYTTVKNVKESYESFLKGAQENVIKYMAEAYKQFGFVFNTKLFTEVIRGVVATLAGGAVSIYFAVNIIKEAQKGDLTTEYWQRVILNLVISLAVTLMATRIMEAVYQLGSIIIDTFSTNIAQTEAVVIDNKGGAELAKALSKIPGLSELTNVVGNSTKNVDYKQLQNVQGMLTALEYIVWFPMIIAVFLMYSSIFEIKIRELFAPLAVSSIMVEGTRGSGARFIKKYGACYLKIALYFLLAYMGMFLTAHFFKGVLDALRSGSSDKDIQVMISTVFMLMSNVVAGMTMMQVGGLTDEILGV